jgi:hypothetical protein
LRPNTRDQRPSAIRRRAPCSNSCGADFLLFGGVLEFLVVAKLVDRFELLLMLFYPNGHRA